MRIAVLFNPVSGAGRALAAAERLRDGLEAGGFEVRLVSSERRDPAEWLRPRLRKVDALVVAGGDGAVRLAAAESARAGVALWHLPCGTENLFARSFGMTRRPEEIAAALAAGRTRRIDLGSAAGVASDGESGAASPSSESFAIMASVGLDADVVHDLDARRRGGISHFSYVGPIARAIGAWRAPQLSWRIDGELEELGPGMAVIGNLAAYGVGLDPARDARPDDGLLDAVFLPARGALELAAWVPLLRLGLHVEFAPSRSGFRMRRGAEIELRSRTADRLQLDGDASRAGARRARRFECHAAALTVLLPAMGRKP